MQRYALVNYRRDERASVGMIVNQQLVDLNAAARTLEVQLPHAAESVNGVLACWDDFSPELSLLAGAVGASLTRNDLSAVSQTEVKFLLPFRPRRVFGAASNFVEHAAEMKTALAEKEHSQPYMFMKSPDSAISSGEAVVIPVETEKADWEVELGVVIGRPGRRIDACNAHEHIAGYTIVNDVSARDLNHRTDFPFKHDWFRGKSWDTFMPLGPTFVPRDCIDDPHKVRLGLDLNGRPMQDGSTSEMIFNIYEQIEYLSSIHTLRPGDLIATGTPAGVGKGRGLFLKPGDVMRAWVEGIGELVNPVVAESEVAD